MRSDRAWQGVTIRVPKPGCYCLGIALLCASCTSRLPAHWHAPSGDASSPGRGRSVHSVPKGLPGMHRTRIASLQHGHRPVCFSCSLQVWIATFIFQNVCRIQDPRWAGGCTWREQVAFPGCHLPPPGIQPQPTGWLGLAGSPSSPACYASVLYLSFCLMLVVLAGGMQPAARRPPPVLHSRMQLPTAPPCTSGKVAGTEGNLVYFRAASGIYGREAWGQEPGSGSSRSCSLQRRHGVSMWVEGAWICGSKDHLAACFNSRPALTGLCPVAASSARALSVCLFCRACSRLSLQGRRWV